MLHNNGVDTMKRRPRVQTSEALGSGVEESCSPSAELGVVIRSLVTILLAQSAADGVVKKIELSGIRKRIQSLYYIDDGLFERYAREATQEAAAIGDAALDNSLYQINKLFSAPQKTKMLHLLLEVAESDNSLSPAEIDFLHTVKEQMSLS
jgi:uncharacterized tellurite resistance protein B-like protein